jgi:organic hydroperoxide reductase OsmC/OhrA
VGLRRVEDDLLDEGFQLGGRITLPGISADLIVILGLPELRFEVGFGFSPDEGLAEGLAGCFGFVLLVLPAGD